MRLGPGLLYEGRTLQGARPKLADFCSATMAEFYSAVDNTNGHTYLAPFTTAGTSQDLLEVKAIRSLELQALVKNSWDGMTVDRQVWDFALCFGKGTRILTKTGQVPVENLKEGDLVRTYDNGLQPIRWIGRMECEATGNLAPIHFSPGAIGNYRPLVLSPQHRVVIEGWQVEVLFGEAQALAPALYLIDGKKITQRSGGKVEYFHLMFDRHEIIFSEGIPTESFHPGILAMNTLDRNARDEIFSIFPELEINGPTAFGKVVRPVLKRREAKLISFRHHGRAVHCSVL